MSIKMNIKSIQWIEGITQEDADRLNLGYGARFDKHFDGKVKVVNAYKDTVACTYEIPEMMPMDNVAYTIGLLKKHHTVPNIQEYRRKRIRRTKVKRCKCGGR